MVLRVLALLMATLPGAAHAGADFDYYVLSLSWSPAWCTAEGDDRDADQCRTGARTGFLVHGLWPQYERGWPQHCPSRQRDPTRGESAAMTDVMGSGGLAWYQWKKHGRCTGLSGTGYYAATRAAAEAVAIPEAAAHRTSYPIAVVQDSAQAGLAQEYVDFMLEKTAQKDLRDAGFGAP